MNRLAGKFAWLAALFVTVAAPAFARDALPAGVTADIDRIAADVLARSGVPSASIAVVRDGQIAYVHAYGDARLDPKTPATPAMRYSIGSISKEFTAAAILMLQQQGKLSLDDPVAKFFPDLTDARRVTLRQILSHTSGYQDYWPQDYLMPPMQIATTPAAIMDRWARKPLDFAPGTQWQYSNTGYVIAGAIVQKVSGATPFAFLQQHLFPQLGITDAYDTNLQALPATDARGYSRYALGPLRPSAKEGVNWMFGAGELALTASDLAKWDIAMIDRTLLSPASWKAMQTEVVLNGGVGSGYGLGVFVGRMDGHRMISHDGEVMGFTAGNYVFPDDRIAVVVLTNQDAVHAYSSIGHEIARVLLGGGSSGAARTSRGTVGLVASMREALHRWFGRKDPRVIRALAQARLVFTGLQAGHIDRALLTPDANSYFDATALHDYQTSLAPLGKPTAFTIRAAHKRGGMQMRSYDVAFPKAKLAVTTYLTPDGKIEQYIVAPAD